MVEITGWIFLLAFFSDWFVKQEVPENKRRVSVLKGIVIATRNAGLHSTFRLRRLVAGVGVESVFPLWVVHAFLPFFYACFNSYNLWSLIGFFCCLNSVISVNYLLQREFYMIGFFFPVILIEISILRTQKVSLIH